MLSIASFLLIPCLTLFAYAVAAQLTLTSQGCVAPTEFNNCYDSVTQAAQTCIENYCESGSCTSPESCSSSDKYCYPACIGIAYQGYLNCAIASCWNKANSCEFQQLQITGIMQNIDYLNVLFPPYYPAAGGVSGACSCRMDLVYFYTHEWLSYSDQCQNRVNNGGYGSADFQFCECCGASEAVSALHAICPNTDPSSLPFLAQETFWASAQSTFRSSNCKMTYNPTKVNCSAPPFDIYVPGNIFYGAQNLPQAGSTSVFNTAGSLATPTAATIVWSLASGLVPSTAIAAKPTTTTKTAPPSATETINLYSGEGCKKPLGSCSNIPADTCCNGPKFASASISGLKMSNDFGIFNGGLCKNATNAMEGSGCLNGIVGKQTGAAWVTGTSKQSLKMSSFECKRTQVIDTIVIADNFYEFGKRVPTDIMMEMLGLAERGAEAHEVGEHLERWIKR